MPYSLKIDKRVNQNLTTKERLELEKLQAESSRRFRDFWIRAMKRQGYSNVAIAEQMGLSESGVRSILKKDQ